LVEALLLVLLGLLEEPQPAITSTPDTTATATGKRWRHGLRGCLHICPHLDTAKFP